MTLLSIINDAQDLVGIPRSSIVFASTDTQVRQMLALANIEGKTLAKRTQWQSQNRQTTHVTLAAEYQGLIATIAPGYDFSVNQTMWNRTSMMYINGPLSPQDWQTEKANVVTGPYFDFRIKEKGLYFLPAPAAGETIAFEYHSVYWCESSGGTDQSRWAADTDVGIIDETLMTMGIRWRFLQQKGLDYSEPFREYEVEVNNAMGRDGSAKIINMDSNITEMPFVHAPSGSWAV